jgi:hypothetical protein
MRLRAGRPIVDTARPECPRCQRLAFRFCTPKVSFLAQIRTGAPGHHLTVATGSFLVKLLTHRGVLVEEEGSAYLADTTAIRRGQRAQATVGCGVARIAFGPRAGQKRLQFGLHGFPGQQ